MSIFTRLLVTSCITLSALSISSTSFAATGKYDFEMIVFERYGQGRAESWPSEPGRPQMNKAVGNLSNPKTSGEASVFNKSSHQLGPLSYTLRKKGARIHTHVRWRQSAKSLKKSAWFRIGNRNLSGLVRVRLGRFLHLDTDLILNAANDSRPYRIQLHRKMRSNELHYLDHPKVGIIIQATPVKSAPSKTLVNEVPIDEAVPEIVIPKQPENDGSTPRTLPDPT